MDDMEHLFTRQGSVKFGANEPRRRVFGGLVRTSGVAIATATAMPDAPKCPISLDADVWHSNISQPMHPMFDAWLGNMGGATLIAATVALGETSEFHFNVRAPRARGT
jgi:hypothetical protein